MNYFKSSVLFLLVCLLAACHTQKQTTAATPATATVESAQAPKTLPFTSTNIEPGAAELAAIQKEYSSVTMATLQHGYSLYIGSSCTGCHPAKPIQYIPKESCKDVVNDMSARASLNETQKDALLKYVLSVKATRGS